MEKFLIRMMFFAGTTKGSSIKYVMKGERKGDLRINKNNFLFRAAFHTAFEREALSKVKGRQGEERRRPPPFVMQRVCY